MIANRWVRIWLSLLVVGSVILAKTWLVNQAKVNQSLVPPSKISGLLPTPLPTPTPTPLSFADMNRLYGPCVKLPVLMYHHVQEELVAKQGGYSGLNVTPATFRSQMQALADKGYSVLTIKDVINFFDYGGSISPKAVVLTFDDGYADFYTFAYPMLREFNFPSVVFLPTGLMTNPGYLNWGQISEMSSSGLVYFGNHTWSHHSVATTPEMVAREISTADIQLISRGLDGSKVFAYPYGTANKFAIDELGREGYSLAFTTIPGSTLCKKTRLNLPRLRVGNSSLSRFGL